MNPKFSLLVACICLGFSACGSVKTTTADIVPEKPAAKGPTLIGRIASAPTDKHFVLVQRYGKWEGQSGQILTTRGPENRTANLRTTGEKLGEFAAADIQAGSVEIGDAVYLQHVPNPVKPSPDVADPLDPVQAFNPLPAAATGTPNVQKNN